MTDRIKTLLKGGPATRSVIIHSLLAWNASVSREAVHKCLRDMIHHGTVSVTFADGDAEETHYRLRTNQGSVYNIVRRTPTFW